MNRTCPTCGEEFESEGVHPLCPSCTAAATHAGEGGSIFKAMPAEVLGSVDSGSGFFEDFEIVQELARGGMGVVFKARQRSLSRWVALKMILSRHLASAEEVRRFRAEAEAAANLDHPHIVPIYEIGEVKGQHYFTMKLVTGGSLVQVMEDYAKDPRSAARLMAVVARAVHYAHQHGILHRDLKPGNILMDENGAPQLTDFGIAKRIHEESTLTLSGAVLGTPAYMAPEQAMGVRNLSLAVDIYGLGAILYHLLTGRPPFNGQMRGEIFRQLMEDNPVRPRAIAPLVDRDLETICLKCLEKEPTRRYGSAEAMAEDLERWLRHEPIAARPATTWYHCRQWFRRHPGLATMLTALLVAILGGGAGTTYSWRQAEKGRQEQRVNLYAADMNLTQQALQQNNLGRAIELLQRHIPPKTETDLRGFEWRFLWKRCQPNFFYSINQHAHFVTTTKFSPDNQWFASASLDRTLKIWDLKTGALRHALPGDEYAPGQPAIAIHPNGRELACLHPQSIDFYDTTTWKLLRTISAPSSSNPGALAFAPDGSLVAAASGALYSWPPDLSGQPERIVHRSEAGLINGKFLAISGDGHYVAASLDSGAAVWDGGLKESTPIWQTTLSELNALAVSLRGEIALGNRRGRVEVFSIAGHQAVWSFQAHQSPIYAMAYSASGNRLFIAGGDQKITAFNGQSGRRLSTYQGHLDEVWSIDLASDGQWIVSGGKDGLVNLWRVEDGNSGLDGKELPDAMLPLRFLPDGSGLITMSRNRDLVLWDVATLQPKSITMPDINLGSVRFLIVSPNAETAAYSLEGNRIQYRDLATGAMRGEFQVADPKSYRLGTIHYSETGSYLAVDVIPLKSDKTRYTVILENTTGEQIVQLPGLTAPYAFDSEDRYLAAGHSKYKIEVRETTHWNSWHVLEGHRWGLTFLAFSPTRPWLASGSSDATIRLWDVESGSLIQTFTGHKEGVGRMQFTPDGRTLVSGSSDDTVRFWQVATGRELLILSDYPDDAWELAVSPAGNAFAVGRMLWNKRTPVRLFTVPSFAEIEHAERHRNRRFRD